MDLFSRRRNASVWSPTHLIQKQSHILCQNVLWCKLIILFVESGMPPSKHRIFPQKIFPGSSGMPCNIFSIYFRRSSWVVISLDRHDHLKGLPRLLGNPVNKKIRRLLTSTKSFHWPTETHSRTRSASPRRSSTRAWAWWAARETPARIFPDQSRRRPLAETKSASRWPFPVWWPATAGNGRQISDELFRPRRGLVRVV